MHLFDRPSIWTYVAAPGVAMCAYVSVVGEYDWIAICLWYITVAFSIIIFVLLLQSYFGRNKFDMGLFV